MTRLLSVGAFLLTIAAGPARADDLTAAARRAADALSASLKASADRGAVRQVAVPSFAANGGLPASLGVRAAEELGARLAQSAKVAVLDPAALRGILGEARLQTMQGNLRAGEPALAGSAQALVTGTLVPEGDRVKLSVRFVLVPSGRAVGEAQVAFDAPRTTVAVADVPLPPPPVAVAASPESPRIEVAMRRVADGLAGSFGRMPGNARYRRLAVLPFGEVGEGASERRLGMIVAAELATNLRRDHGLLLAERDKLGQVLGEVKLQQMASPDPAAAARIGQIAEAQALVVGSVAEAGDRFLVTARIVVTETGESLAAESASVPAAGLVALASDAVVLRSRGDAAFRSLLVPGLGQAYNRQSAKAWAFGGAALALAGGAVAFHLGGASKESDYENATTSVEATRRYDEAQRAYQTRNWLLVGLGAVWAVNVIDAWASGVDGEAALGGGVVVAPVATPRGGGLALAGRF